MDSPHQKPQSHHHHYILPTRTALMVGGSLLLLTGVTVAMSHVHLGPLNMLAALAVASIKASLVAVFFMNLRYDKRENAVIFCTSFLFLAIFIVFTCSDLFFRGDVYVKGPLLAQAAGGPGKFKKPWVVTPELVSHGKELFGQQCVSCHGVEGKGDGPAAAALDPHPRNFHQTEGWQNGWKPSQIFYTLQHGARGAMSSYATLPAEGRWALAHFVASLNPQPKTDDTADLAQVGVDSVKGTAGGDEQKSIPIDVAIQILTEKQGT